VPIQCKSMDGQREQYQCGLRIFRLRQRNCVPRGTGGSAVDHIIEFFWRWMSKNRHRLPLASSDSSASSFAPGTDGSCCVAFYGEKDADADCDLCVSHGFICRDHELYHPYDNEDNKKDCLSPSNTTTEAECFALGLTWVTTPNAYGVQCPMFYASALPPPPPPTPPPTPPKPPIIDDDDAAGLAGILVTLVATTFNTLFSL